MAVFPRYHGPPLIEQVCTVENLTNAWRRVRSNVKVTRRYRSAGIDRMTLDDFAADWPNQMALLAEELRNGSYRPLPPRWVTIPKTNGGKRAIAILTIRDRIAQRAVQQVLNPLFEPLFLDCSYGCRLSVGVPEAIERVMRYVEQGLHWVVDGDISAYFDSIDHGILLGLLRQRIDEPAILQLIGQWLAVGFFHSEVPDDETPPASPFETMLRRSGELIHEMLKTPLDSVPVERDDLDLYSPALVQPRSGLSAEMLAALSLMQPAFAIARQLVPLVQRIGVRRLALGGALAVGTVALSELIYRLQAVHSRRGTLQGGPLSPLLANIYLHPFDIAMTAHGARMVRFVDDFVVMCPDRTTAERTLVLVERQLAALRLTLNWQKTRIVDYADGIEFLGQALAPRRKQGFLEGIGDFHTAEQRLRAHIERLRKPKSSPPSEM
ncbi:MAG: RNA-dependent DNA polymerase [Chloroflexus sp.]|jgi:RNA-directed DNA polymerase|nr:RNA-dependent DNA polymerase [Chloroflexus sp.]MBO9316097.1 RNA-dependent DNA polymerase [Chloroflexus sp.]MBO9319061.1 RNA-dependent DNA polymerase [Chloroflexus sp.]MBO9339578.1 RNA-dependent DNA polymerase [Chloroflexus sp.]MBO9349081.1 RNA-dependent DNA polymerase [Chloroflexus sp.]